MPAKASGLSWFLSATQKLDKSKTHAKPLRNTLLFIAR
jgi:hypothetical protein